MKKTDDDVDGEEGRNALSGTMCSEWIVSQEASEGGNGGEKGFGKTEKCGDDKEEEEKQKEAKSLLHVRMCISLVFLCTVLLLVLCFFTCLWFCVGVTFCFTFYVFFVLCAAPCFLTFFLCSLCVHHTWVKQPVQKLRTACLTPTRAEKCGVCHSGIHKLHKGITKKKEKEMK